MALILQMPVDENFKIIYGFWQDASKEDNQRRTAYKVFDNHHPGIDLGMPEDNNVYASFDGIVVRREWHEGMGNVIGVRNGNIVAIYAHLNKFLVNLGEKVTQGQTIALSGNTGSATIEGLPHLHFELRDITQPTLKEMVFKPEFGKPLTNLREEFSYTVFNGNTSKTLKFLAMRYFGSEEYSGKILSVNPALNSDPDVMIEDGIEVIIPNY